MHDQSLARGAAALQPAEPRWSRAPSRDVDGSPLSDFMMIIPGLRDQPERRRRRVVDILQQVLSDFAPFVVFADLNLKINVLWVTVRPRPGICVDLPTAIFARIPDARLVGFRPQPR